MPRSFLMGSESHRDLPIQWPYFSMHHLWDDAKPCPQWLLGKESIQLPSV